MRQRQGDPEGKIFGSPLPSVASSQWDAGVSVYENLKYCIESRIWGWKHATPKAREHGAVMDMKVRKFLGVRKSRGSALFCHCPDVRPQIIPE